ncbi:response regulator [Allohahella marinimesophila]
MPNLDLAIMVVDDAKFSSAIIARTLKNAGYRDIRIANTPHGGVTALETRPASVLIADWLMPEMDGLELADRVRQLDEAQNHFTYIILLTAREGNDALLEAFDRGVDDFIHKSDMNKQLLPRIYAADRTSEIQNNLLTANQLLLENNNELQAKNGLDLLTGMPNHRMAHTRLADSLKQAEARGGASCILMIGMLNWQQLKRRYSATLLDELIIGVARRLRHLTRPLDMVARFSENQFVVISQFNDIEHCTSSCFRRVHEGLNLKAFKTSSGFVSIQVGTGGVAIDASTHIPSADVIEQAAHRQLAHAYETGTLSMVHWKEVAKHFTQAEQ